MKNLSLLGMAVLMATSLSAYSDESDILNTADDTATVAQGDSVTIDVLANDTGTDMYVFDASDVWTGSFSITWDSKIVYNEPSPIRNESENHPVFQYKMSLT